jgi:hypothetical protein
VSRRIDIELTSSRDDGTWTWRAAGAREPRGVVDGSLLPSGSSTGDVLRADVETSLDGTTVLAVLPPKGPRSEPDRIELVGAADPDQWVTTVLAPGRPRRDGDRRERRGGREGGRPPRPGRDDRPRDRATPGRDGQPRTGDGRARPARGEGRGGEGGRGGERPRSGDQRPRTPRPPVDTRPKPKRLRPHRTHRKAVLADLPPEQQPVAEQVLKGGIPAVRAAVAKQNEQARTEGKPEVKPDQLIELAEKLLPKLRVAEWRDRAEAAMADLEELDLRDLRSVIVAAEGAARDEETRALATSLREGLARRVDEEQASWRREIASTLGEGRVVRALRLSSRPPKAGDPLPADLATRLIEATNAALAEDTPADRWATVLDALSFSPVHLRVEPASVPAEPGEVVLTAVRAAAARVPQIAARFGIDPATTPPPRRSGPPPGRRRTARKPGGPPAGKPARSKDGTARPKPDAAQAAREPKAQATPPAAPEPEAPAATAPAPAPPVEPVTPEPETAPDAAEPQAAPPAGEAAPEPEAAPSPAVTPEPPPPVAPVPEPGTPEAEPAPVPDEEPAPAPEAS